MDNRELALQLTKAAIAGGAVKFITEGTEEEINKANAEKIIKFYNEMENEVEKSTPNFGAQVF